MSLDNRFSVVKSLFEEDYSKASQQLDMARSKYDAAVAAGQSQNVLDAHQRIIANREVYASLTEWKASNCRDVSETDLQERSFVLDNYKNLVQQSVSDNLHVKFHGTSLRGAEGIIRSGGILTASERDVAMRSQGGDGICITDKNSIDTTVNGFCDLSTNGMNKYLPAGCIFVLLPKDESYDVMSNGSSEIVTGSYDFKEDESQLYAVFTTTENVSRINDLMRSSGLQPKVFSFADGLTMLQRDSAAIDMLIANHADVNLSNSNAVQSALQSVHTDDKRSTIKRSEAVLQDVIDGFDSQDKCSDSLTL